MRIRLKGVHKATAKGCTCYYAWRGRPLGPRLRGEPGSPEFLASYNEAIESYRTPDQSRFRALVVLYKATAFRKLAASTAKNWTPWLDRIAEHFGDLRIAQFERTEKIRPLIRQWRNRWADKPRTADYGMGVLSVVLSTAVEQGRLAGNPCEGIKGLYEGGNRSEIVWTDADIAALKRTCSPEIAHAADLAAHTALRLGDLVSLSWSHVGENAIEITTSKTKKRALIPLYDALRDVLARIPKRATTILTNSLGRPWTAKRLSTAFSEAKQAAGLTELHFHDLRGTAATRMYVAGLPLRVIAEITAWEEETVEKIIRRYVGRAAATRAYIAQLNKAST